VYGAIDAVDAITDDREKKKLLRAVIAKSQNGTIGSGPGERALEKLNLISSANTKVQPEIAVVDKIKPKPDIDNSQKSIKKSWWRRVGDWFV